MRFDFTKENIRLKKSFNKATICPEKKKKRSQKVIKTNLLQSRNINIQHSGFETIKIPKLVTKSKSTAEKAASWGLSLRTAQGVLQRVRVVRAQPVHRSSSTQSSGARSSAPATAAGPGSARGFCSKSTECPHRRFFLGY